MSQPIISVDGLSKAYRIGLKDAIPDTLVAAAAGIAKAPFRKLRALRRLNTFNAGADAPDIIWALRDVSFDVAEGEVLGIIGRNGAGKSTLLKILSRITEPTRGRAVLRGRVSSLLEVGTGFHPELTGRENVYLNGTVLGMTKREIDRKFDEIVDFSGVEKFLDTPIKRYSSGMTVRLAFAVAAHLEPEILIVDEVLAVGDAEFQKKCMGKMQDVARGGRTVLFVSHNIPAILNLCSRCVVLYRGSVLYDGDPVESVNQYTQIWRAVSKTTTDLSRHAGRQPGSIATMQEVRIVPFNKPSGAPIEMGDDVCVNVWFKSANDLDDVTFGFIVKNHLETPVFGTNTVVQPFSNSKAVARAGRISGTIEKLPLMPGDYTIDLYFGNRGHNFDVVIEATSFSVEARDVFGSGRLPPVIGGSVYCPASWELQSDDQEAAKSWD